MLKQSSHASDHKADAIRLELPLVELSCLDQTSAWPKEWKTRSQYHEKEMSPPDRNRIVKRQAMLEANLMIPDPFLSNKAGLGKFFSTFFLESAFIQF